MGHYCWCCGRMRPNERFSGRGHRDHICKTCQKLPKTEREFGRARNDIDRLLHDGSVKKKKRHLFQQFLAHPNERVRQYAESILEFDRERALQDRKLREEDEESLDRWLALYDPYEGSSALDTTTTFSDDDIPF